VAGGGVVGYQKVAIGGSYVYGMGFVNQGVAVVCDSLISNANNGDIDIVLASYNLADGTPK